MRKNLWAFLNVLLLGCGVQAADPELNTTGKSDINGADDRQPVSLASSRVQKWAQSTVLIVLRENLRRGDDETTLLPEQHPDNKLIHETYNDRMMSEFGLPLCEDEPFRSEPSRGLASGFLVAPNVIATVQHAVVNLDVHKNTSTDLLVNCEQLAVVFGYHESDMTQDDEIKVPNEDVRFCSRVIDDVELFDGPHWLSPALMVLDEPVTHRASLPLANRPRDENPEFETKVTMIGHPMRLPTKVTTGIVLQPVKATQWSGDDGSYSFRTSLDAYRGNSGSVVLNDQGEVEGVLAGGGKDFEEQFFLEDGFQECLASRQCPEYGDLENKCFGNFVTRAWLLQELLGKLD